MPEPPRHPLERLLRPVAAVPTHEPGATAAGQPPSPSAITAYAGPDGPEWIRSGAWRLFAPAGAVPDRPADVEIARFTGAGERELRATIDPATRAVSLPFSLADAFASYVSERWREQADLRSLSPGQLASFYRVKRLIPRRVQLVARRALIRRQGRPEFPRWPLDDGVRHLLLLYARCLLLASGEQETGFRWFWPAPHRSALVLTHDVESSEGLRLALELADLEQDRGLRSSFNVVADWYAVDHGILRELRNRGFEIGVHGVRHDRSMFASRESFDAQQPLVQAAAREFEAEGFRSPATHRVYEWLGDLPLRYDSSVPHSDPYEPLPGGCCSLWPFFIRDVVELPYTLPQDHTLLTLLRVGSAAPWLEQLDAIRARNGMALALTHPDPGYLGDADKRRIYADFLDGIVARPDLWTALPRDVARWWRARDEADGAGDALGRMRLIDEPPGVVLEPAF